MNFDVAHRKYIQHHLEQRRGERKGRLERGHNHAEYLFLRDVWWPLQGNFNHLHPEYEVPDWRGRSYFADFSWLPGQVKLLFEIKGFASHVRDMDRQKYCSELNREMFLFAMGYHVLSFAYDDIEQRPDLCISMLRMCLSRFQTHNTKISRANLNEKEFVFLALQNAHSIRPKDVEQHFEIDHKTAILMLQRLKEKGWLQPTYGAKQERVVRYSLTKDAINGLL
ncbi:hypothetical protein [Paenibacillus harenae]|uniref:hypothetical protein n=1 Tax=Paenibacillus harenae TaxID=306543 RepID=UPI0027D8BD03|nr:hypothetical protein [Paenibacillus harenae]